MSLVEKSELSQDDPKYKNIEVIELSNELYSDNRRVKIKFLLSDFQINPNAAITLAIFLARTMK